MNGIEVPLRQLRKWADFLSGVGTSLLGLSKAARKAGVTTCGVGVSLPFLKKLPAGSILYWRGNHFVVLRAVTTTVIVIVDPAPGERRVSIKEAKRDYSGLALLVRPR